MSRYFDEKVEMINLGDYFKTFPHEDVYRVRFIYKCLGDAIHSIATDYKQDIFIDFKLEEALTKLIAGFGMEDRVFEMFMIYLEEKDSLAIYGEQPKYYNVTSMCSEAPFTTKEFIDSVKKRKSMRLVKER